MEQLGLRDHRVVQVERPLQVGGGERVLFPSGPSRTPDPVSSAHLVRHVVQPIQVRVNHPHQLLQRLSLKLTHGEDTLVQPSARPRPQGFLGKRVSSPGQGPELDWFCVLPYFCRTPPVSFIGYVCVCIHICIYTYIQTDFERKNIFLNYKIFIQILPGSLNNTHIVISRLVH